MHPARHYFLWPLLTLLSSSATAVAVSTASSNIAVIVCAGFSIVSAIMVVLQMRRHYYDIKQTDTQIALFIRGQMDARVPPVRQQDQWGVLKYRLNNLLDILDVVCRGKDAAIDGLGNADYLQKLSQTPLHQALLNTVRQPQHATFDAALKHAQEEDSESDGGLHPAENDRQDTTTAADTFEETADTSADDQTSDSRSGTKTLLAKIIADIEATHALLGPSSADDIVSKIEVRQAAERAQKHVDSVADAANKLGHSIQEIAGRVMESSRIAEEAVSHAQQGNRVIHELNDASSKIGDIVDLISDIAGQTNLLALNATIEAARAGEAGKGFSVVASEVKDLADQTSEATDDIALQVNNIQNATKQTTQTIRQIGKTITTMSEIATMISKAITEQASVTEDMGNHIQHAVKETAALRDSHEHEGSPENAKALQEKLEQLKLDLVALLRAYIPQDVDHAT
jgi:uncharacterized protein YoxC